MGAAIDNKDLNSEFISDWMIKEKISEVNQNQEG